jgi:hypothetical protein
MTRSLIGWSLGLLGALSLMSGCSSEAVDGTEPEPGGIIGGTGGSADTGAGSGGDTATAGGTSPSAVGGTSPSTVGGSSTAAGTGSGGGCQGAPVICVDAETAQACDPATGVTQTVNCAEALEKEGLMSNGCLADAEGVGCTVDGFLDEDCLAGTPPFAVCGDLTQDELFSLYTTCYLDEMGAKAIISCYAEYLDEAAMTVDCAAAEAACFPPDFMP